MKSKLEEGEKRGKKPYKAGWQKSVLAWAIHPTFSCNSVKKLGSAAHREEPTCASPGSGGKASKTWRAQVTELSALHLCLFVIVVGFFGCLFVVFLRHFASNYEATATAKNPPAISCLWKKGSLTVN